MCLVADADNCHTIRIGQTRTDLASRLARKSSIDDATFRSFQARKSGYDKQNQEVGTDGCIRTG